MRLLQEHIKRVIESKRIIRQKIAAINLRRNLDGRRRLKDKLQKATGFWKVRRAVNKMIEKRRKAKAMILRFVRRWQARKAEERAALEAKKKSRKKSKNKKGGKDKKKKGGKDGKDDKKKSSGRKSGLKDDGKRSKKESKASTSRDVSPLSMAEDKRDKKGKKESRTERSGKRTEVDQSLVIQEEAKEGDDDGTRRKDKKSKRGAADEESKEQPATDRKSKRDRKERSPDLGDD